MQSLWRRARLSSEQQSLSPSVISIWDRIFRHLHHRFSFLVSLFLSYNPFIICCLLTWEEYREHQGRWRLDFTQTTKSCPVLRYSTFCVSEVPCFKCCFLEEESSPLTPPSLLFFVREFEISWSLMKCSRCFIRLHNIIIFEEVKETMMMVRVSHGLLDSCLQTLQHRERERKLLQSWLHPFFYTSLWLDDHDGCLILEDQKELKDRHSDDEESSRKGVSLLILSASLFYLTKVKVNQQQDKRH